MDTFFIFCANYLFVAPFLLAAVFFFKQKRNVQINIVIFGLCCALVGYGIALLLGQLYFDPRPFVAGHFKPLIDHDTENGFPSDHVLLVSTVSAVLTVFAKRLSIYAWICTILIAIARVYVGVHHIIDVAGSLLIASGVTALFYILFKRYWPNRLAGQDSKV
ncbi:MAG: phosphatase PAP2 family protein [Niabella sp.]|nr:phosphatase PAP2 family protein [Niabella sp.]